MESVSVSSSGSESVSAGERRSLQAAVARPQADTVPRPPQRRRGTNIRKAYSAPVFVADSAGLREKADRGPDPGGRRHAPERIQALPRLPVLASANDFSMTASATHRAIRSTSGLLAFHMSFSTM